MSKKTKKSETKNKPAPKKSAAKTTPPMSNKAQDIAKTSANKDSDANAAEQASKSAPMNSTANDIAKRGAKKGNQPPVPDANDAVLGVMPPGEKPVSAMQSVETKPEPNADPLRLPRGAFVALRKSGGLNFSTREVVVYPDGRVAYDARGVPQKEYTRLRRVMNDGQVISLRKLLDQTNFWKTEGGGKQNPDAFAYEIAANLNHRSNELEIYDGSIPENLQPLLDVLTKLLPS